MVDGDNIGWIENAYIEGNNLAESDSRRFQEALRVISEKEISIPNSGEQVRYFIDDISNLFVWFKDNYRVFPWRFSKDPWEILVAEVLLQRTKANIVSEYYKEFLERFPGPVSVTEEGREELKSIIEPLGFGDMRTETFLSVSEQLVEKNEGNVPASVQQLTDLPRIGRYTGRAVACFAFGEPVSVIDANVSNILYRYFSYNSEVRPHKDDDLYSLLDALIPNEQVWAQIFNLAMIDLGSLICVESPNCPECPLNSNCAFPD